MTRSEAFYSDVQKFTKQLTVRFIWGLFSSGCLGMNFPDCCTNEPEFRICTNCNNIQYTSLQTVWKKCQLLVSTFANVCYFFWTNAFLNVYDYFWTFNTSMHDKTKFGSWVDYFNANTTAVSGASLTRNRTTDNHAVHTVDAWTTTALIELSWQHQRRSTYRGEIFQVPKR